MRVRYSYLPQQFQDSEEILNAIRAHLVNCQFTLGPEVEQFERSFAALIGARYAVGVGSGTDALALSLKALGIGHGDEVITAANTFIATVGAIHSTGARPVLVDVRPDFTIDPALIERALTPRTKAIIPVHLTGEMADMDPLLELAGRRGLPVVEDACQAIGARYKDRAAGTLGAFGAFSLHPLKNLNVWGDAGVIVTNEARFDRQLRLLRNHGLSGRDEVEILGVNSRLDSIQAIVGNRLMAQAESITEQRIANAARYDRAFAALEGDITLPPRRPEVRRVFHLYQIYARRRDDLYRFLLEEGIEAKIHYPIPLPLQRGLQPLGYHPGDFPETERQSASCITLPVDQHLSQDELDLVVDTVTRFYREG
ncbi:MAG: DegT/DnrJ/EryC1/StrS family aminotransferase [Candidatus Omnitrophica bacterium]|nr:DegT/DnrJ/EryC1/StrS family aminotransferase [Candidatus Omnitrophota bacterium]